MTQNDLILLAGFILVAAGFGYRNLLASLVGRIVLLFGQQISEGDRITVAGTEGIVESINLRCTVLRTLDNVFLYVPNSMWLSSPVIHWSAGGRSRRIRLPITVSADSDLGRTTTALRRAAEDTTGIASKPTPRALIIGIEPSGVKLELWAWLSEPRSIGRTIDELGRNVQEQLSGRGSSRSRGYDSSRSRSTRDDRRDRDRNDRPRRSSRPSGDRSRDRGSSRESNPAPVADTVNPEPKSAQPATAPPPEAAEVSRSVDDADIKTTGDAQPVEESNSDNGNSEESVSYGRSKRRVPRR